MLALLRLQRLLIRRLADSKSVGYQLRMLKLPLFVCLALAACSQRQPPALSAAATPTAGSEAAKLPNVPAEAKSECPKKVADGSLLMCGNGLAWSSNNEQTGACEKPKLDPDPGETEQERPLEFTGRGPKWEFSVVAQGPSGSGRYWHVAVIREDTGDGFCTEESTVGFRSLVGSQAAQRLVPLRWIADLDSDGQDELVLWGSFPLRPDSDLNNHGLVPTVYRASANAFVLDKDLTRQEAKRVAAVYRDAAKEGDRKRRTALARELDARVN